MRALPLLGALTRPSGAVPQAADFRPAPVAPPLASAGHGFVWLFVLAGFFVMREPSPYELLGVPVMGAAFLLGLSIPRPVVPLLALLVLYVLGGFIGVPMATDVGEARFQLAVTAFLGGTSVFFACYCAPDPIRRIGFLRTALQCGALIATVLGVMGYFNVAGTADLFTLNDRVRGTFEDPNVFGPFASIAFVFAVYTILSKPAARWPFAILVLAVCSLGILLSFSRGAWGLTTYATAVVAFLHFVLTPHPAERLRIVVLACAGLALLVVGLMVALSIPAIADLFAVRANLLQSYDSGELGRFGRQFLGFQMTVHHPLGIGTFGFRDIFGIEPHNVYLGALLRHWWMGFFAYFTLVMLTVYQLVRVILYHPPLRTVAVPLFALLTGLMLLGFIIDTDRWRHFFLLLGLCWGVIAASIAQPYVAKRRRSPTPSDRP